MSIETMTCPHCQGTGKLLTKTAEELVPGDVLLPDATERLLTIRAITNDGEDRLTLAGTDDHGEDVQYHGVPRTRRLPVARKIRDLPQESH